MGRAFRVVGALALLAAWGGFVLDTATAGTRAESSLVTCPTAYAQGARLPVSTAAVRTPGGPNGVVSTSDGRWSFAWLSTGKLAVFSDQRFAPVLVHQVALATSLGVSGEALTSDGRYLLAATGDGAAVVNVARAESGSRSAVLGSLSGGISNPSLANSFAINVVISADGDFAFVTIEYADEVAVFNLHDALDHDFRGSSLVGTIPINGAAVGLALSPDGRWLYVTSERSGGQTDPGAITVVSAAQAEEVPAKAVVSTVTAGACGTVRDAVSPDGRTLWITARDSNELLAFSTAKLRSAPTHARLAVVTVGKSPVGLALLDGGQRVVTADELSNGLSVISASAALSGKPALLGTIATGATPRDLSVEPNGTTLLVTDRQAQALEAVNVGHLP